MLVFIAVGLIGMTAVGCLGEMMVLFPTESSIDDYLRTFLDENLGWVAGLSHWRDCPILILTSLRLTGCRYTCATILASLAVAGAELLEFLQYAETLPILSFPIQAAALILVLSFFPVKGTVPMTCSVSVLMLAVAWTCDSTCRDSEGLHLGQQRGATGDGSGKW